MRAHRQGTRTIRKYSGSSDAARAYHRYFMFIPATNNTAAEIATQAIAVPRSGSFTISNAKQDGRRGGGKQHVLPIGDLLPARLQKVREIQNECRLGDFRGLERQASKLDPAMRVVRVAKQEDGDQQQRSNAEKREHYRRPAKLLVVDVHDHDHGQKASRGPCHLPHQKAVGRAKAFLGHHRRRAEDHHQSDEDQQERNREQPLVDAHAFGHL